MRFSTTVFLFTCAAFLCCFLAEIGRAEDKPIPCCVDFATGETVHNVLVEEKGRGCWVNIQGKKFWYLNTQIAKLHKAEGNKEDLTIELNKQKATVLQLQEKIRLLTQENEKLKKDFKGAVATASEADEERWKAKQAASIARGEKAMAEDAAEMAKKAAANWQVTALQQNLRANMAESAADAAIGSAVKIGTETSIKMVESYEKGYSQGYKELAFRRF